MGDLQVPGAQAPNDWLKKMAHPEHDELLKEIMDHVMQSPHMQYVDELMKMKEDECKVEDEGDLPVDMEDEVDVKVEEEDDDDDKELEPAKLKAQRDQGRRQYSKLLASHKELETRLAKMERTARLAERKSDLVELEAAGVMFDIGEELDYVSDLDAAKYAKHLNKMKKNYSKAPIGVKIEQAKPETAGIATPDSVYNKLKTPLLKTHDMLN